MGTRNLIGLMFDAIEAYRSEGPYIPYSLEVKTVDANFQLLFRHDTHIALNHVLYISNAYRSQLIRRDELDFLKACKEIGNRYIRELNSTP